MKITVETIREAVKSLRNVETKEIKLPFRDDICLTISGVICIPGIGFLHPETFRGIVSEEIWQEVLRRPRITTSYDLDVEEGA